MNSDIKYSLLDANDFDYFMFLMGKYALLMIMTHIYVPRSILRSIQFWPLPALDLFASPNEEIIIMNFMACNAIARGCIKYHLLLM